jgi:hypothetical protein
MDNEPDQRQTAKMTPIEHLSPFDWADQADELGDNLQEAVQSRLGATAFSSGLAAAASSDYVFRVDGTGLKSHLLLQPRKHELGIAVVGPPDTGVDEVERWTEVVREALRLFDRPRIPWPWAAVIAPAGTASDPGPCLMGITMIGGMTLRPASRAIRRSPRQIPWSPARPIANAWPAVVEGSGWTPDWQNSLRAQQRARGQLHRLCALLTVVFDGVPWRLEWDPSAAPPGYLDVPDWLLDADAPDLPFSQRSIEMPNWINAAWSALDADRSLDQALALYYEGSQLRGEHPSIALVALVGSIESLARTELERCQCCDQLRGSTRRFKEALAEVLTDQDAEELGRLYASRSKTAHAGKLFGFEATFNVWDHNHFIRREGRLDFTMRLTYEAQRAGGLLLVRRFEEAAGRRRGA